MECKKCTCYIFELSDWAWAGLSPKRNFPSKLFELFERARAWYQTTTSQEQKMWGKKRKETEEVSLKNEKTIGTFYLHLFRYKQKFGQFPKVANRSFIFVYLQIIVVCRERKWLFRVLVLVEFFSFSVFVCKKQKWVWCHASSSRRLTFCWPCFWRKPSGKS